MNAHKRNGYRWSVNELLSLQREYELLEWTVQQIADKHQRSVEAILYRLESEGLINSWVSARGFDSQKYQSELSNNSSDVCAADVTGYVQDSDEISEVDKLTERVWNLETSVSEIGSMVKQMFENMVSTKTQQKTASLRKN
jgi:hypothetical protein